ncbi:Y-family DNA polymerase [Propionivibrio limicola]|uniref:Y-family DNA polymerase n=1 Tax=Propionivibrio limicola TaxID=167645 RepID=UPI0012910120|nr:DNA polymerase Y family protein [Propionivibrio limicola]
MVPSPVWLALHLPYLPLEANASCPSPSAVVERGRILLGDEAARQAGIESGIGVAAARALAPGLTLLARDPSRESAALQTLACWAGRFTPRVSLTPDTLLLEVGSCLRLFGGLKSLVDTLRESAEPLSFTLALAAAPTPLAAQWLAQQGEPAFYIDLERMRQHLGRLPVEVLPAKAAVALRRFGASTLAEVRCLPSAQLARRIGAESLQRLAQAFGEAADLRPDFVFPERFSLPLQLPSTVDSATALVFAARRLTSALAGWLAARQSGVREVILRLRHERDETPLPLNFSDLTADGERFERVLRERLERLELMAPVDSLCLEATDVAPLTAQDGTLFNDVCAEQGSMGVLLERLRARLGDAQVYRLAVCADHRPERATRRSTLQEKLPAPEIPELPRPLWLLAAPEALREVDGRPYRQGPLELLAGPERIESGWWEIGEGEERNGDDNADIRRDYFIAQAPDERWLWIYRECRTPGGWFLHGYFS